MTYDLIGAINAARARQPASGGKTYKRAAVHRDTPAMGTWERLTGLTTARWECCTGDALAQYQFDVYGDSWKGL